MNPAERYLFERAEKLHMTVSRMESEMSSAEYAKWMALDFVRNQEREKAERMAKQRANSRGRG